MGLKLSEQERKIATILSTGVVYTIIIDSSVDCQDPSKQNKLHKLGVWKYFNGKKNKGTLTSTLSKNELLDKLEFIFGKNMISLKKSNGSPFQGLPI
ncbi:hypothetical protein A5821_002064 [Enterococcus sp. 7F3_DIV0205]|uniref:Uncharacterized protein n=1 Tax=Candidatus Enterococcus palustris TaxID=1834189 RepID=A0AAQ3WCV6_9ENTE|nr:hypothetical protein [Enterococcus sp. 7F3_DIV0205]OTN82503.1 hypothetical protein A5821_002414 [Enterococcus sp. 7F3_DIV0205]